MTRLWYCRECKTVVARDGWGRPGHDCPTCTAECDVDDDDGDSIWLVVDS